MIARSSLPPLTRLDTFEGVGTTRLGGEGQGCQLEKSEGEILYV